MAEWLSETIGARSRLVRVPPGHGRIGDAELRCAKPAARCAVTTVDQDAGSKSGPESLKTLADYRRAAEGGLAFGAKFAVIEEGKLSVGDEVVVRAWGPSEL